MLERFFDVSKEDVMPDFEKMTEQEIMSWATEKLGKKIAKGQVDVNLPERKIASMLATTLGISVGAAIGGVPFAALMGLLFNLAAKQATYPGDKKKR